MLAGIGTGAVATVGLAGVKCGGTGLLAGIGTGVVTTVGLAGVKFGGAGGGGGGVSGNLPMLFFSFLSCLNSFLTLHSWTK